LLFPCGVTSDRLLNDVRPVWTYVALLETRHHRDVAEELIIKVNLEDLRLHLGIIDLFATRNATTGTTCPRDA
jgi:hypothetical protein